MKHIDTPRHIQLECLQQMDELKTGRLFSLNNFIAVTDLPSHYDNSRASTLGWLIYCSVQIVKYSSLMKLSLQ